MNCTRRMINLFLVAIALFQCSSTKEVDKAYLQNLEKYLSIRFPEHQINREASQYVLIPSFGCSGCIQTALNIHSAGILTNTFFITNVKNADTLGCNSHWLYDNNTELLNQINFGVQGKPIAFQIQNRKVVNQYAISLDTAEFLGSLKSFDKTLGN